MSWHCLACGYITAEKPGPCPHCLAGTKVATPKFDTTVRTNSPVLLDAGSVLALIQQRIDREMAGSSTFAALSNLQLSIRQLPALVPSGPMQPGTMNTGATSPNPANPVDDCGAFLVSNRYRDVILRALNNYASSLQAIHILEGELGKAAHVERIMAISAAAGIEEGK